MKPSHPQTQRRRATGPRRVEALAPTASTVRNRVAPTVIAATILAIALLTRLPRPLATPGWDGDEGYNVEIAWNLAHGDARMYALDYRFVAHPPLAYAVLAPALRIFGRDLAVARVGAGVASGLAAAAVAWGLARAGQRRAAVLGGLALAVAPFAVAYGRMAYTYGLLALVGAITIAAAVGWRRAIDHDESASSDARRPTGRRGAYSGLTGLIAIASLGPLIDHAGLALPILVAVETRLATRSWLVSAGALAVACAPTILVYAAIAWIDPVGAEAEWRHVVARLGGHDSATATPVGAPIPTLATTLALILANTAALMRAAWWWPLAVAGCVAIPSHSGRATILRAFALTAIPAFAVRPVDITFRAAIPLLPFAGWGLGIMLDRAIAAAFDITGAVPGRGPIAPRLAASGLAALFLLPLGLEAATTAVAILPADVTQTLGPNPQPPTRAVRAAAPNSNPLMATRSGGCQSGHAPRDIDVARDVSGRDLIASPTVSLATPLLALPIDALLLCDPDDAYRVAAWVNARTSPTDLVIASAGMTWLLDARVADHLQATARALPGTTVAFYPPEIAVTRWRFDATPTAASYVILDHVTDAWVDADSATRRVFGPLRDRPAAFRAGSYRVIAPNS